MTSMTIENIKEKRQSDLGQVAWDALSPHAERGGLILVAPHLDLLDVAAAVTNDHPDKIRNWIESGELRKPEPDEIEALNRDHQKTFRFVIVQPFVLAKPSTEQVAPNTVH